MIQGNMENVYRELDNVKAEMERLKADRRVKMELYETLKRVHTEQSSKFQEAKREVENQAQELNVKLEEISQARQVSDTLRSCLHEKESSLRHLSSLHEKLRTDCELKLKKMEGENKELAFAFDEVSERNKELEQNACASRKEIESLKRRLSTAETKYCEAEQRARAAKDLRQRDDVIMNLEAENRNAQDQLKWKKEQFKHLEEAHRRLQDQFKLSNEEWQKSESVLLEKISLLQTSLDSKTRILEDVQNRLEMCNQALAQEESKKKFLEVEVSEFKLRYESVFSQCQQEKSKFESLTVQRDEEIAKLRNSLGTKDIVMKEIEIRTAHLEQENKELRESLKEFQEDQIRNAGATSLTKLRNKLKGLEQVHSNCLTNLKVKESEWSSQIEKMKSDINGYNSDLKGKEKVLQEVQLELESCHCMVEILSEEISVLLTIFKSELSDAYSQTFHPKVEMELCDKMDGRIPLLTKQLEMKDSDLRKVFLKLEKEREQAEILMNRVRSLEHTERKQNILLEELQQHKDSLEASVRQLYLKNQLLTIEGEKQDISETLEKANLKISEKICYISQLEDELKRWKSDTERWKISCEENQEKNSQMENSLLVRTENEEALEHVRESLITVIKEKTNEIEVLQQKNVLLQAAVAAKNEEVEACTRVKENFIQIAKGKDSHIGSLQQDINWLEQECMRRELEAATLGRFDLEESVEQEKERLSKIIIEKDQNIKTLEVHAMSVEQDLMSVLTTSFAEVVENLVIIAALTEAFKKVKHMSELQIENYIQIAEDKDSHIGILQQDINWLEQECMRRELEAATLARFDVEESVEQEKERLSKVINEKDQNIKILEVHAMSVEQDLMSVLTSSFSEVVENLVTIDALTEAFKKVKHMSDLQIEDRNKKIVDLENEVSDSCQKLRCQEESLLELKEQAEVLQALLEAKELETSQLMAEQRSVESQIKQLEFEKNIILQDKRKLSKERERVLVSLEEFCDRIGEVNHADAEMMSVLETMLQGSMEEVGPAMGLTFDYYPSYDCTQEKTSTIVSGSARKLEASSAGRLPLKEMNHGHV